MNTDNLMEERLWDYIDGLSSTGERTAVEALIEANIEWQRKYKELLGIHQLMQVTELEEPSMRFTKNVMEEIARLQIAPAAKTYINKNIIRGIGAFFLTLIAGFLAYSFGQFNWSSLNGNDGIKTTIVPTARINEELGKVSWGKLFSSTTTNVFMLVTIILALMLLDIYLSNKRGARRRHA